MAGASRAVQPLPAVAAMALTWRALAPGRLGVWVALMAARPIAPVEIKSVGFAILRSGSPRKRNGPVDRRQQPHISDDCAQILFFEVGKRHCHVWTCAR
jgi:hypothetical protein